MDRKDRVLAKVALAEGVLTKEQVREALAIQEELLVGKSETPELARILVERGFLEKDVVRRLQVRTKEKLFEKLYRKIKEGEEGGGGRSPPLDEESTDSPAEVKEGESPPGGHEEAEGAGRRRGVRMGTTRKRRALRRRRGLGPLALFVLGVAVVAVVLAGVWLLR
ncbi:MAG: hypothetical protein HY720_07230 [Planctomycetes bacterium]|nr:hypothetical protein [Planctomycetota bacterium]